MNRRWRFVAAARKKLSKKLLWFGVRIAGPSAGIRSASAIRSPHQRRMKGTKIPRTSA